MASAPRPGRKGGKLTDSSPSPVLVPATARTPPSEIKAAPATDAALPDAPVSNPFPSPFLSFDMAAVDLVGKGTVRGGAKSVRTESRSTQLNKDDVSSKLQALFELQVGASAASRCDASVIDDLIAKHDVVALSYHEGFQLLLRQITSSPATSVSGSRALVIVPSYFVVEKTASAIRKALGSDSGVSVSTWVGASVQGTLSTSQFWVVDAKTALQFFATGAADPSCRFNGITHVAFFKARAHQPIAQLVLEALRGMPSFTGKILIVGGSIADDFDRFTDYVAPRSAAATDAISALPPNEVVTVSFEEACALTEREVISVAVDRTGKFPGPHPKVAEHALEVTIAFLETTLRLAKTPQVVVIFAAEVGETLYKLEGTSLNEFIVIRDELVFATEGEPASPQKAQKDGNHRIHVFNHCDMDELGELNATMVIDKGTTKCSWVPSPAEAAFPCKRTEWQSRQERQLRRRCLGWGTPGVYVSLFPTEAESMFPPTTALHLELIDMEGALLQCSRVKAFVTPERLLTPFPKESILRAMSDLTEVCGIVDVQDLSFTFTGEILSRLPTLTDVSMLCWYGLVSGLEEAAIAAASLATIRLFSHKNDADQKPSEWLTHVAEQRAKFAGEKAKSSDVLADTLVALRWLKVVLSEGSEAGQAFAEAVDVPIYRFKSVVSLMSHLRAQLTDYAILESFDDAFAVDRIIRAVESNWDILVVLIATAFCRKAVVVRTDGEVNLRDITGNTMFMRTAKTAAPNCHAPSSVKWKIGNAVIGTSVMNTVSHLLVKDQTTLKASFYLTALTLLTPIVEYSAPQLQADGSMSVYFSFAANGQSKRIKASVETAARILEFRSKWNTAYGALMIQRSLPRTATLSQLTQALRSIDKSFSLKDVQTQLRNEFIAVFASELLVVEDHRTFTNTKVHRFSPDASFAAPITAVSKASDDQLSESLLSVATQVFLSPTPPTTAATAAAPAAPAVSHETIAEHTLTAPSCIFEDDEVEDGESYFVNHGPLIEDDDDDE